MARRVPLKQLAREFSALGDPLRLEILEAYAAGGQLSPKGLSDRLRAPLGNVSYHVKVLLAAGLIVEVDRAQRRGAVEHFYGLTGRGVAVAALARGARNGAPAGIPPEEPDAYA
jgi:DNA-binding transcriptional ArsR family regulator